MVEQDFVNEKKSAVREFDEQKIYLREAEADWGRTAQHGTDRRFIRAETDLDEKIETQSQWAVRYITFG